MVAAMLSINSITTNFFESLTKVNKLFFNGASQLLPGSVLWYNEGTACDFYHAGAPHAKSGTAATAPSLIETGNYTLFFS